MAHSFNNLAQLKAELENCRNQYAAQKTSAATHYFLTLKEQYFPSRNKINLLRYKIKWGEPHEERQLAILLLGLNCFGISPKWDESCVLIEQGFYNASPGAFSFPTLHCYLRAAKDNKGNHKKESFDLNLNGEVHTYLQFTIEETTGGPATRVDSNLPRTPNDVHTHHMADHWDNRASMLLEFHNAKQDHKHSSHQNQMIITDKTELHNLPIYLEYVESVYNNRQFRNTSAGAPNNITSSNLYYGTYIGHLIKQLSYPVMS